MARIVLGIGCAHTPQMHTAAPDWDLRAARDRADGVPLWFRGRRLKYAELAKLRTGEALSRRLEMSVREAALARCFGAMDRLHGQLVAAAPDIYVIIGNDQFEIFTDTVPAFAVIAAEQIDNMPRTREQNQRLPVGIEISDHGHLPETAMVFPGHRQLGLHIASHLVSQAAFDVTLCHQKPTVTGEKSLLHGMPHAYGFLYKNVIRDCVRPQVPIDVNCWHYENSPSAGRCHAFGEAVAQAIEAWDGDARVVILTSGGLTHFVVDEEWDRRFLQALMSHDMEFLRNIPQSELMAGTSECKSWIAAGAAMDHAGLTMQVVDYQALYRTEGGTGSSCAFVSWTP